MACVNDVNVSQPSFVASFTTHTTTPPRFVTRYNSFASASKSQSNPLYVRRLSYGGEVTVKSIHSSGNPPQHFDVISANNLVNILLHLYAPFPFSKYFAIPFAFIDWRLKSISYDAYFVITSIKIFLRFFFVRISQTSTILPRQP